MAREERATATAIMIAGNKEGDGDGNNNGRQQRGQWQLRQWCQVRDGDGNYEGDGDSDEVGGQQRGQRRQAWLGNLLVIWQNSVIIPMPDLLTA
jgi:hypothetical protein